VKKTDLEGHWRKQLVSKKKVMLVFGTRPEAIKMAPVYHAIKAYPDEFELLLCVTAQHREMLDQVLRVFDMVPDIDLDLMKVGQDLFDVTANVLLAMREVLRENRPDILLVHGDTSTTFASSLAAFYSGIEVGHVEAGLRTKNFKEPFPEEFNRQVTSKLASWHFAPTKHSRENLLKEGIDPSSVFVTGNTVIDALFWALKKTEVDLEVKNLIHQRLASILPFSLEDNRFVLITGHRRENFGDGFLNICKALRDLAKKYPQVQFVYPVHMNPNVQDPVTRILSGFNNVHLIDPLDYEPFLILLKHCFLVLTDSGGIQEEAPSLGKPVLVMRDVTERPEGVEAGAVKLVGANKQKIIESVSTLLDDEIKYSEMSNSHNPYGDGSASIRILDVLRKY